MADTQMNSIPFAIIGTLAAVLAFDKRYEDGLIRHASLGSMVFASVVIVVGEWFSFYEYDFPWEVSILAWSFAVFLACHAYSFMRWRLKEFGTWWSKT